MKRLTLVLLSIALAACGKGGNSKEQYRTEKADRGVITRTVTATGTLSAVTTVQIGSQVSGVISQLYADFNSRVKRGQLLAELDPTPFQAQVEQRRADLTRAQVEAANARVMLQRQRRLAESGLAPEAEVDAAKARFDSAQAQVSQSAAALRQAETNARYTKITSPIDGVVVDRQYDVGQTVAASFQAPTLFSIAQDLTKMQVQADVDQADIGNVQVGQSARFTVDAYPDEEFKGRIAQIRLNALVNQNVVSYPVIIEVPNPDERLRPKMTANVTIDVATVNNVLRIPNASLRFRPESERGKETTSTGGGFERRAAQSAERGGGLAGAARQLPGGRAAGKQQTVYKLGPDNKPVAAQIRTGITDGRHTQVVSGGVKAGDTIIVGLATSKVEGPPPPGAQQGGGGGRRRQ